MLLGVRSLKGTRSTEIPRVDYKLVSKQKARAAARESFVVLVPLEDNQDTPTAQTSFLAYWCSWKCDMARVIAKIMAAGMREIQGRMWKHLNKHDTHLAGSPFYVVV